MSHSELKPCSSIFHSSVNLLYQKGTMIYIDLWDRKSDNRSQCPRNRIVEHPAIIKQPSFFICIPYGQNSITLPSNNQSAKVSVTAHLEWICVSPALQLEVPSCWDNFGAHPLRASRPAPQTASLGLPQQKQLRRRCRGFRIFTRESVAADFWLAGLLIQRNNVKCDINPSN